MIAAGVLVPGSRLLIRDVGVNWTRTGFLRILRRMQGIVLGDLEDETGELIAAEPVSDLDVAARRAGGHDRRGRGGAARDRRAAARRAARLLRRGRDGRARRAGAARQGVRPHRRGRRRPARPRRRHRGQPRRLRRARHRRPARRHDRRATATTAWRCSARSPASPRARASRSSGWRRPRSPTRRSSRTCARLCSSRSTAPPAPASRPSPARSPRGSASPTSTPGRCTGAWRCCHCGRPTRASGSGARCERSSSRARRRRAGGAARRARRHRGDPHARGLRGRLARRRRPAVREALVAKQRELIADGDWVAEGRDIGTVVAPDAEVKVFLTADAGRARSPPRRRARRRSGRPCWPSRRCATSATAPASTARCTPAAAVPSARHDRPRRSTRSVEQVARSPSRPQQSTHEGRRRRLPERRASPR